MAKYKVQKTGQTVNLGKNDFVAKGGEGEIYIQGDRVYKICIPGAMIPEQKMRELAVLTHPRIIIPEDVLLDGKNKIAGYAMRAVPGQPIPLAQMLSKAYREHNNVAPAQMVSLVTQIADGVRFIHRHKGYLQVDGNEFNYMVTNGFADVFFIDVNSYQTPNFPVNTIMASIRDYHVKAVNGLWQWSPLSDWWSFAIISFYMFTGIHPFKGRHPGFTNIKTFMADQMTAYKSVLDPQSAFPKAAVYFPFEDVIPGGKDGAYMQWYRALFVDGKRMPAPLDFQAAIAFVAKVHEIIGSNNFDMKTLHEFASTVLGCYFQHGKEVIVTKDSVYVSNQPQSRPADRFHIGFCPVGDIPVAAWLDGDDLRLQNLEWKIPIPIQCLGRDIMSCEGRLYVLGLQDIFELTFMKSGQNITAFAKPVAGVMPKATRFYEGVAIQDMFGVKMVSIFPQAGHHQQIKIDELANYRITAARYEGGVLMVVGVNRTSGEYDRLIIRFAKDWASYDCRVIENVHPTGLNFTVTSKGICVCIDEEEKVEIFSIQKGSQTVKSVSDPAIKGDMKLCHSDDQVRFAHGKKLYSFAMK